tara:strand:- start:515 stop:742 length:228 start_codon:yes stop_codon:yes gene_type:complete
MTKLEELRAAAFAAYAAKVAAHVDYDAAVDYADDAADDSAVDYAYDTYLVACDDFDDNAAAYRTELKKQQENTND